MPCVNPSRLCVIVPRTLESIPEPKWDGPAVGNKAATDLDTGEIWIDSAYWDTLRLADGSPDVTYRASLVFHEVAHQEGAECENCADHRAGEWLCMLGFATDVPAVQTMLERIQYRNPVEAASELHAGFTDCATGNCHLPHAGYTTSTPASARQFADHERGPACPPLTHCTDGAVLAMLADEGAASRSAEALWWMDGQVREGWHRLMGADAPPATQEVTGYKNGSPFDLMLEEVRPDIWIQQGAAAAAFRNTFDQADALGIAYHVNSSYRDMGSQISTWNDRMQPAFPGDPIPWQHGSLQPGKDAKGPAAYPGWSLHQQGLSVDLGFDSDSSRERFAAMAEQNGIYRDAPTERWHFSYGTKRAYPLDANVVSSVVIDLKDWLTSSDETDAAPDLPEGLSFEALSFIVVVVLALGLLALHFSRKA